MFAQSLDTTMGSGDPRIAGTDVGTGRPPPRCLARRQGQTDAPRLSAHRATGAPGPGPAPLDRRDLPSQHVAYSGDRDRGATKGINDDSDSDSKEFDRRR